MTKEQRIQILKDKIIVKADIWKAAEAMQYQKGIEIGVRKGGNSLLLCNNPHFDHYVAMDCWTEDPERPEINDANLSQKTLDGQYNSVVKLLSKFPHAEVIRDFSVEGSARFEDEYFDLIYIDAAHDYESVRNDLAAWWPKLKPGGLMSGHDYFPDKRVWRGKECGVWKAVHEFAEQHNTEVHHSTDCAKEGGAGRCCPSFFIIK